ncbi:Os06g0293666 [Oryza sativa Japonica Group]|uniref:Os06g0293666 protein n=1 Tax=Oryza sativa subsp. japonica TaxID=39947 RepID=A0A0N7KLY6_ORYSJ|nr:Os06g0293666 [Oryza sativa Japonica Group]
MGIVPTVYMGERKVDEMLYEQVKSEASGESLEEITWLALECLQMCGANRPAMKEIAERLGGLWKLHQNPWMQDAVKLEEARCLLHGVAARLSTTHAAVRHPPPCAAPTAAAAAAAIASARPSPRRRRPPPETVRRRDDACVLLAGAPPQVSRAQI